MKPQYNTEAEERSFLFIIQTGSRKKSQDIDTICPKTLAYNHTKETVTSNKVVILEATREVSKNIIIRKVAYEAVKKSLVIPSQELKNTENEIARVKRNMWEYPILRRTLSHRYL